MLRTGGFERIENPQAYLTRTARNVLIDRARRRIREQTVIFPFDEGFDAPVPAEQAWQIEEMDLRRVYRQALRAMQRRTRRIFLMHRLRSMTYKEIAVRMGISVQGVEYHMMRALAQCRDAVATSE
ncbi:MAG: sigma-70 family RNA polymerase sigma factor [Sphingorhabdus sp.]